MSAGAGAGADFTPLQSRAWPLATELLLLLAAGALHALSFAPPVAAGWLQAACVALLAWRVAGTRLPGHAAALGGAFSVAWLGGGVWWLFISMHRYGGMPAWLAALAVLLLCGFLSLYLAAAMAAWVRWRPASGWGAAALFAALWLLAELARGVLFTGFPWVAAGYAHVDGALAGLAPWLGVYGIGAWSAFVAAFVATAVERPGRERIGAGVAALALWWLPAALPLDFTAASGTLSVALLQGNVPQDEKFEPARQPEALAWTVGELLAARADLVIAPETAIPVLPAQLPEGFWQGLRGAFADGERAALVGIPLGDAASGYTNSAIGLSRAAAESPRGFYRYDKHHLVPFGEFIPPGFRWFVDLMNMPLGDFNRGPLAAPAFAVQGQRVAPNICYEDLFGEELAARFVDPLGAPTVLANLSNIAWFGESVAIAQHLQISRLRALELQRPMVRATNTGATVIIDHRGVVTHALAPHSRGVLRGPVQGRSGLTPFAAWAGHLGLWPLGLAALAGLLAAVLARRRQERVETAP